MESVDSVCTQNSMGGVDGGIDLCRICQNHSNEGTLDLPCRCKGSINKIH